VEVFHIKSLPSVRTPDDTNFIVHLICYTIAWEINNTVGFIDYTQTQSLT